MTTECSQPTQQSAPSVTEATWDSFKDYFEQLCVTSLAVKHWWILNYRKTRMTIKNIQDAFQKSGQGKIIEALADTSPLTCEETDKFCLQETYFGISILVMAMTLGGIVGNLWTELACWGLQMGVLEAMLIIITLPLRIFFGFCEISNSEAIVKRRSELYIILFFMGFSMGQLCEYSLLSIASRLIPPFALAIMLNNFCHMRPLTPSGIRRTRIEMFMAVPAFTITSVCFLIFFLRQLTLGSFFSALPCIAINLLLLFVHFQLYYYGLCVRGRWNLEAMCDDPQNCNMWTLDSIIPYIANSDIIYALAVITLDVILCTIY